MPNKFQKKKAPSKKKNKKIHEIDGKKFSTKGAKDLYEVLKNHLKNGFIHQFNIPEVDQEAKNKYGSKKCQINDITFDSMLEARFFLHLLTIQELGKTTLIETHPKFILQEGFKKNDKRIYPIHYNADFKVTYSDGTTAIYDTKGRETADFKIKKKLFFYKYPDLDLICVKQLKGVWVNKDTEEELPFARI